jgi:hypothetical protein
MKNIQVSDADYEILMELSKELQTQENDHQAFPYFWEPHSEKCVQGGEDDTPLAYHDCETYYFEDLEEDQPELWEEFLLQGSFGKVTSYDSIEDVNCEIINFIEFKDDWQVVYEKKEFQSEHNPSLFKSDVKSFCDSNKHHLGANPQTYARTVWRMPKMESLIKAIYRLNKQHEDTINHEALRFVIEPSPSKKAEV